MADAWVAKGAGLSRPLLTAVGAAAAATEVIGRESAAEEAPYGQMMVCWPDPGENTSHIWHISDGGFFLDHLRGCYRALLGPDARIDRALAGESRLEMAFTNDVLQVQLPGQWKQYSMVRHHALMLFHGLLWLDDEPRSNWAGLYDALLQRQLDLGLPSWDEIETIEEAAFGWYQAAASATWQPALAHDVLEGSISGDPARYQQLAAAAIALLWREHQQTPPAARVQWQISEIAESYAREDYLADRWQRLRKAQP